MKKRLFALLLAISLLFSIPEKAFACDERQTKTYVTQILFGDEALKYESDEKVEMLLNALYMCSEQSNNLGQDKLDFLKRKKVSRIPSLSKLSIKKAELSKCSHRNWEYEYKENQAVQSARKNLLQRTVNKIFDFGLFSNWFGSNKGKSESFAALLYYSHILSDYIADDPANTEVSFNGQTILAYSGKPFIELNGNKPSFTDNQKKSTESFIKFSLLDSQGRCGVAFANISSDSMPPAYSRQNIGYIKPSGWNQEKYSGIVNSNPPYLYNRCHLIAHQLAGEDGKINLITGTRYLNIDGMKPFEDKVAEYVRKTGNHVLYRVTPVFKGDNQVASGVQLEAYSVEDAGGGICFNVYCYNVQPGVKINYTDGSNSQSDTTFKEKNIIPFAVMNPCDSNPDLIYEINKHLEVLFKEQNKSSTYTAMTGEIRAIKNDVQAAEDKAESSATDYVKLKKYQYQYFDVLKTYIPLLLKKEKFFKSTFGKNYFG